jgi:hypothetical protein
MALSYVDVGSVCGLPLFESFDLGVLLLESAQDNGHVGAIGGLQKKRSRRCMYIGNKYMC